CWRRWRIWASDLAITDEQQSVGPDVGALPALPESARPRTPRPKAFPRAAAPRACRSVPGVRPLEPYASGLPTAAIVAPRFDSRAARYAGAAPTTAVSSAPPAGRARPVPQAPSTGPAPWSAPEAGRCRDRPRVGRCLLRWPD